MYLDLDELEREQRDLRDRVENGEELDSDERTALAELDALAKDLGADDVREARRNGVTLIEEDAFASYARDMYADYADAGTLDKWPFTCIDWGKASEERRQDYTEVEFRGSTYLTNDR